MFNRQITNNNANYATLREDPISPNVVMIGIDDDEEISGDNIDSIASRKIELRKDNLEKKAIEKFIESSASSLSASNEARSTDLSRLREFRKMVNSRKEP